MQRQTIAVRARVGANEDWPRVSNDGKVQSNLKIQNWIGRCMFSLSSLHCADIHLYFALATYDDEGHRTAMYLFVAICPSG